MNKNSDGYEPNINDFSIMKNKILQSNLKSDRKENDVTSSYHVTGSIDLNMDNKEDKISVTINWDEEESNYFIDDALIY